MLALRAVAKSSTVEQEDVSDPETLSDDEEARLLREHIAVYRLDGFCSSAPRSSSSTSSSA